MATNPSKEVPQVEVDDRSTGTGLDVDTSSLDPAFNYRWVHKVPIKVARARQRGYEIVSPAEVDEVKNNLGDEIPAHTDGTYTMGDVVLMRIPKARRKALVHAGLRRAKQRLRGPEKKFRRDAEATGAERGIDIEVITDKGD